MTQTIARCGLSGHLSIHRQEGQEEEHWQHPCQQPWLFCLQYFCHTCHTAYKADTSHTTTHNSNNKHKLLKCCTKLHMLLTNQVISKYTLTQGTELTSKYLFKYVAPLYTCNVVHICVICLYINCTPCLWWQKHKSDSVVIVQDSQRHVSGVEVSIYNNSGNQSVWQT